MFQNSLDRCETLSETVTLWLARMGCIGLAIMMFLTLFDVIGRAFNYPIAPAVEITEIIMGMMIYLGVGYTTFMRGHIRVDILITNLPKRIQALLDTFTGIIGLGIVGLMSWRLFIQASSRVSNNDLSQILEIPLWPYAFVMAISSTLIVTSLLYFLFINFQIAIGVIPAETRTQRVSNPD